MPSFVNATSGHALPVGWQRRPAHRRARRRRPAGGAAPASILRPADGEELRRLAIYNNYRALVDTTAGGGYGRSTGRGRADPAEAGPDGQIYGVEYLAFAQGGGGDQNVTLMVQIPEAFDPAKACIVTGPSSGSRGVYGAIGTSGEWGLKKGCAVAYTDKGTGIGAHDLERDTVTCCAASASRRTRRASDSELHRRRLRRRAPRVQRRHPDRWAWKHAHSELNPEADWDERPATRSSSRSGR